MPILLERTSKRIQYCNSHKEVTPARLCWRWSGQGWPVGDSRTRRVSFSGTDVPELPYFSINVSRGYACRSLYHQQFKSFPFAGWGHFLLLPHRTRKKGYYWFGAFNRKKSQAVIKWIYSVWIVKICNFQYLSNDKDPMRTETVASSGGWLSPVPVQGCILGQKMISTQ